MAIDVLVAYLVPIPAAQTELSEPQIRAPGHKSVIQIKSRTFWYKACSAMVSDLR